MAAERVPGVTITWRFSHPADAVWRAWTDPALMKRWFGSDPHGSGLLAHADVRPGGSFEVEFANSDGSRNTCYGTYREVEAGRKLVFTWAWREHAGPAERVTVRLEPEDGATAMIFQHDDIDPGTTHDYAPGWKRTFQKLQRVLDEGGSRP